MNPALLLFVEDIDSDYEMAVRGLRRLGLDAPTRCCPGIGPAEDFLFGPPGRVPGLIVLDFKLPDGNGTDILPRIRADHRLRDVPVAVWSASTDPAVIELCYRRGADRFVAKAADRALTEQSVREFARLFRFPID